LKDVDLDGSEVRASVRSPQGGEYTIAARFFADATGQHSFLANKLRMRRLIPALRHIAIYGHFKGVVRDEGIDAGNTISIAIRHGWMWFIPLADDITSIGAVVANDAFKQSGLSSDEYFDRVVQEVPVIRDRLANAARVSPVHVTSDFSYTVGPLFGERHVILGDAGFFLDPIFSSGVHLAISAGVYGADAIHEHLTARRWPWRQPLKRLTEKMWRSQKPYWAFVHGWYAEGFLELFLRPTDKVQMVPAIVSVLAGSAQISPGVRLRTKVFLFLVWLQRTFRVLEEPIDRAKLPGIP
jgi:flavin-dependent dehydrogenase